MREEHSILVRHVPRQLRDDQIESLFSNFGASSVRVLSSRQKKTALAFVTFRSLPEAQCAVSRVHQMEVLGYRLSAELSRKNIVREPAGRCDSLRDKEDQYLSLMKRLHLDKVPPHGLKYKYPPPSLHVLLNILSALYEHRRFYTQVLHLMNKMNLPCPFNSDFVRADKIDHLLRSQTHWDSSTLHQNLDEIEVPESLSEHASEDRGQSAPLDEPSLSLEQSDTEEEVESELEDSDRDENDAAAILNLKQTLERKRARSSGLKRPKFIKPLVATKERVAVGHVKRKRKQDTVFEPASSTTAAQRRKQIQVRVSSDLTSISTQSTLDQHMEAESHSFGSMMSRSGADSTGPLRLGATSEIALNRSQGKKMLDTDAFPSEPLSRTQPASGLQTPNQDDRPRPGPSYPTLDTSERKAPTDPSYAAVTEPATVSEPRAAASYVSLQPGESSKESEELRSCEEADEKPRGVISKEQLDANRLSERDRSFVKAFNNYSPGVASCRLYVKNLAKTVTQDDVEFVFRRYFLPDCKEQGTMFDVRLMQEGRMKGQAFITLQTVQQARQALLETNGFILKDKPMVVQYARSIQAKPAAT